MGWIISVVDVVTKSHNSRLMHEERSLVSTKLVSLKNKYDSIDKDRYRICIQAPYVEAPKQLQLKCLKSEEKTVSKVLTQLADLDAVCIMDKEDHFVLEMPEALERKLERFSELQLERIA